MDNLKAEMKEGEALYIKMLPEENVGVRYFNGKEWTTGKVFTSPWHKIMGFFNDLNDIKAYTIQDEKDTTLKPFHENYRDLNIIKNMYDEIAEIMYEYFSCGSSVENCKGWAVEDALKIIEKYYPNLKRMTAQEYREKHPMFKNNY